MTQRRLSCSCCGESAGRWHQFFNQDTGFGICLRCITWFRQDKRHDEEDIAQTWGKEGVNWGAGITVHGREFQAVACFVESPKGQAKANAWMAEHPTHALLATQDGYYWLADINDKGAA